MVVRETFPVGMLGCNCTIVGDTASQEAMVVDPGADLPKILAILAKHQLEVKRIVVTHAHFDHIGAALELKRITGAPVVYNKDDLPLVAMIEEQAAWVGLPQMGVRREDTAPPDHSPADGEDVGISGVEARVLPTPGHTEGSLSLYLPLEGVVLAGDTLFAGGVGRTDFPGGNTGKLLASIRERLLVLPKQTVVVPGHGPETTIGVEAASNPFLS